MEIRNEEERKAAVQRIKEIVDIKEPTDKEWKEYEKLVAALRKWHNREPHVFRYAINHGSPNEVQVTAHSKQKAREQFNSLGYLVVSREIVKLGINLNL